jgi:hypothetical protein
MRIQLTIRRAGTAVPDRDVVVEGPQRATAGELARVLGGHTLSVAGRQVGEMSRIGMPPLLDGTEVTLDDGMGGHACLPEVRTEVDDPPPPGRPRVRCSKRCRDRLTTPERWPSSELRPSAPTSWSSS